MTPPVSTLERHPSFRAQVARSFRGLHQVKGANRLARAIAGNPADPTFQICNDCVWFAGSLNSLIERQVYLAGGYERGLIETFLALVPDGNAGCAIDVGANVGTHSLAFATHFARVISFDPGPIAFESLSRNVALNPALNVTTINCGLGDVPGTLPFFAAIDGAEGLGTFVSDNHYDTPIVPIGERPIMRGDDALADVLAADERVLALKLDVQGYEPKALAGLRETLARHRPLTWVESSIGTQAELGGTDAFLRLFPYPVEILLFCTERRFGIERTWLEPISSIDGIEANVVIRPRD